MQDTAAARDQFAALLPVREWVSGRDHPDTITDRANVALWTQRARSMAIDLQVGSALVADPP
jgi:hypothetical protein